MNSWSGLVLLEPQPWLLAENHSSTKTDRTPVQNPEPADGEAGWQGEEGCSDQGVKEVIDVIGIFETSETLVSP